jgi:proteic killer suppression protein
VILSFADTGAEDFWNGINSARARKIPANIRTRLMDRLTAMDIATNINDLRVPPSNHLEELQGNLAGLCSIRVNKQFRVIFRWDADAAGPSEVRLDDHTY